MGYVNPDRKPEPRGFEDQFEWDGHGWLFRRFHRSRPVRVTADEMDQSIGFYQRWRGRLGTAGVATTILAVTVSLFLDAIDLEWADARLTGLIAATMAAISWVGDRWAWAKATERFTHRVPVGLGQTWLEDRQSLAADRGWTEVLWAPVFVGVVIFLMWPFEQARWFEVAMGAVAGIAALGNFVLKLRARIL